MVLLKNLSFPIHLQIHSGKKNGLIILLNGRKLRGRVIERKEKMNMFHIYLYYSTF